MPELVDWLIKNVPEFNEKRLPSLYSDLAQQQSANPDGFAANVASWEKALNRAALGGQLPANQRLILEVPGDLLDALRTPRFGQPTRLGLVFDESVRRGTMMALNTFKNREDSIYHKRWIPSIGTVGSWLLYQTGIWSASSFDSNGKFNTGQLVLIEVMDSLAKQVYSTWAEKNHGNADSVMTRDLFERFLTRVGIDSLTSQELDCLLLYMQRDREMLTYNSSTVKFKTPSASSVEPITEEDISVASIKSLMSTLETQISSLNAKVQQLQEAAQNHVRAKNRSAALAALKSKKLAEKNLEQRMATYQQLEEVFSKIEQASDQVQIIQVMQSSAMTLKSLNQRVGGVDRVDAVMEDLREQMGQTDEVGQVITEPLSGNAVLDDAEIDDEFEALQKEEAAKKEQLEAEATQERLSELVTPSTVNVANDLDAELAASAEKLNDLSLDDDSNKTSSKDKIPQLESA